VTSMLDVRYRLLPDAPELQSGDRVRLLVGTAEVMANLHLLDEQYAQLRTAEPVATMPGDRFILRRQSPVTTLGGGEVLDPWAPRLRTRDLAIAIDQLQRLERADRGVLLERAGRAGLSSAEARFRGLQGVMLADRVLAPSAVEELTRALLEGLSAFHAENPLALGAPRRSLKRSRLQALDNAAFDALLERTPGIVLEGPRVRLDGFGVRLTPKQEEEREALVAFFHGRGWEPTKFEDLASERSLVEWLMDTGVLTKVAGRLYLQETLNALIEEVRVVLAEEGELSPARFKKLTGLTRRGAIPLLEWLDAQKVTRRQGDVRVAWG